MDFGSAMELELKHDKCQGWNGCHEYISTDNDLVSFFFKLVRDLSITETFSYFEKICNNAPVETLADLVVLTFHTRATRNMGKGERKLFYDMLMGIQKFMGEDVLLKLLPLIPHYGYYKDYIFIMNHDLCSKKIYEECKEIICRQILEDFTSLTIGKNEISLLGKYMPREKGSNSKLAFEFADKLFEGSKVAKLKKYRKMLSSLNRDGIKTVTETFMCSNRFSEIDFTKVASLCLNRNKKAFMNETMRGSGQRSMEYDRIKARENLINVKTVHGGQLFPHDLVKPIVYDAWSRQSETSIEPVDENVKLLDKQWKDVCEKTFDYTNDAFSNTLVMVDTSGSMTSNNFLPISVAIAMGIIVSENCGNCFKDMVMTFHSQPELVSLKSANSFYEKVNMVLNIPWGYNTNLFVAFEKVVEISLKYNVDTLPNLMIVSDMQFDEACHATTDVMYEQIQKYISSVSATHSLECVKNWKMPKIIFWNVNARTRGFPVKSNTTNTILVSGFSPSLLKNVFSENYNKEETPEQVVRNILDDENFEIICEILSNLKFGKFATYKKYPFLEKN